MKDFALSPTINEAFSVVILRLCVGQRETEQLSLRLSTGMIKDTRVRSERRKQIAGDTLSHLYD